MEKKELVELKCKMFDIYLMLVKLQHKLIEINKKTNVDVFLKEVDKIGNKLDNIYEYFKLYDL